MLERVSCRVAEGVTICTADASLWEKKTDHTPGTGSSVVPVFDVVVLVEAPILVTIVVPGQGTWWVLPAANYIASASLKSSDICGIRSAWGQSGK